MLSPSLRSLAAAIMLCAAICFVFSPPVTTSAAGKKKRDPIIAIRFHAQVAGYDPTFAAKIKVGNPPREVTVEKIPSISERDIAAFYPYRASDGSYSAVIKLDRHGEATLEAVSTTKRGLLLVTVVNGRPITSLLVDKTIKDGIIYIPLGLTEANIQAMGASFSIMGDTDADRESRKAPTPAAPLADSDLPSSAPSPR